SRKVPFLGGAHRTRRSAPVLFYRSKRRNALPRAGSMLEKCLIFSWRRGPNPPPLPGSPPEPPGVLHLEPMRGAPRAIRRVLALRELSKKPSPNALRYSASLPPFCARFVRPVRFLQRSANLFTQSHCRAHFLLGCHEATTDGGGEWLATSLMSP